MENNGFSELANQRLETHEAEVRQSTLNFNYDTNKVLNGTELTQAVRRKMIVITESDSKPESQRKIRLQNTGSSNEP